MTFAAAARPAPPPTFASAVLSGEGDIKRSFMSFEAGAETGIAKLEGDTCNGCDKGVEDFLGLGGGAISATLGAVATVTEVVVGGRGIGVLALELGLEVEDGVSNSAGRVRGVACTLVMSFALEQ